MVNVVVRTVPQQVDRFPEPRVSNIESPFIGVVWKNILTNVRTKIVVDSVAEDKAVPKLGHADLNAPGFIMVDVVLPDNNLPGCDGINNFVMVWWV